MTIYLEIFFIKNLIFNFLLLFLTSLIIRKRIKIHKVLLAAFIGGIYAISALYSQEIFNSIILKIFISIVMITISFGKKEITTMLSSFFILTYIIAGIITSIMNVSGQIIMILFAISISIIYYIYNRDKKCNEYIDVKLEIFESEIDILAKIDTGNELRDSMFGNPVIVVSESKAKKEFEDELIKILNNERLDVPEKYKKRVKLISFKTISGEGIKIGIKLDKVIIYSEEKMIENKAIMILTERKFNNYDALIGKSLLEGGYECENISFDKIENKRTI